MSSQYVSNSRIAYTMTTDKTLNVFVDGKAYTVSADHPKHRDIVEAIRNQDADALPGLISLERAVSDWVSGSNRLRIRNGQVYWLDHIAGQKISAETPINYDFTEQLLNFMEMGLPCDYHVNFIERVMRNPFAWVIENIWKFMNADSENPVPILNDGRILLWKRVKADYYDLHTGKTHKYEPLHLKYAEELEAYTRSFDAFLANGGSPSQESMTSPDVWLRSKPGNVVWMPLRDCDQSSTADCAEGLHAGNWGYVGTFGNSHDNHLLRVAVDPAHILISDKEVNQNKLRCHFMEVREECDPKDFERMYVAQGPDVSPSPVYSGDYCPTDDEDEFDDDYDDEDDDDGDYDA